MEKITKIVQTIIKLGGDDMLRHFQTGLMHGSGRMTDDVARLLAGTDDALRQGYNIVLKNSDDVANVVTKNADNVMTSGVVNTGKTTIKQTTTRRVAPPKAETPIERKINSIKERLKGPQEAYNAENVAFRKAQQAHIDKFNKYVDDYTTKYSELVVKLDDALSAEEVAKIEKELKKLEAQAEKTIKSRLEKLGTLSPSEIQTKIKEVKDLTQLRVQNLTYASATSDGARAQAQRFIEEVAQEFSTYNRKLTPEQLKFMLEKRVDKIERLVKKAQLEDKMTIRRTAKFGGMDVPIEFSVMGTEATDEIAKLCGGKAPKEALEYYRTLQRKMDDAISNISGADALEQNGYIQMIEGKINIPIKDAKKSDELTWLEQQLKEKTQMLKAEADHQGKKQNYLAVIS